MLDVVGQLCEEAPNDRKAHDDKSKVKIRKLDIESFYHGASAAVAG